MCSMILGLLGCCEANYFYQLKFLHAVLAFATAR